MKIERGASAFSQTSLPYTIIIDAAPIFVYENP
jgi:hypothetical protein